MNPGEILRPKEVLSAIVEIPKTVARQVIRYVVYQAQGGRGMPPPYPAHLEFLKTKDEEENENI